MAGEPNERQDGTQSRLRWARESSQYWQYGLGAVLLGVLLPVSVGVPPPSLRFGEFTNEVILAVVLIAVFANVLVGIAAHIGRRRRELWFALAGTGLAVVHPVLDGTVLFAADWIRPARIALGAAVVLALASLFDIEGWFARTIRWVSVTLASMSIITAGLLVGGPDPTGPLLETAALAFGGAAAALGGIAFIYGQREPDGALLAVGMTALAVGFGEILLLSSGGVDLTVGVATVGVVASVAAFFAAVTALFEALARREIRREAIVMSRDLAVARLEAQASRFSELAHDQRSTLLAIEAAAEQMRAQPSGELAAAVAAEAARLNRLLANTDAGPRLFELRAAVMPLVQCMRAFGSEIGIVGDRVSVWGDVDEIVEIIGVLVDNALTHGDGPIRIELDSIDGAAVLRVSDAGAGVPLPLRESVFERGVTTSPAAHSGLGLFSARRMAEAAGGSLRIPDGRPATFELALPMQPARPASIADTDTDADGDTGGWPRATGHA